MDVLRSTTPSRWITVRLPDRGAPYVGRGLLALALVVGAGAGHAAHPWFPWLGPWFVVLTPVLAGLVYGPLVQAFAREARGHEVPEVMYAVARRGGRVRPQVALVKALASALCIGGGGSVGREGPIVQIGSALGSTVRRVVRAGERQMRLLVACGAAGGIAATFNAPLAGVFFAVELILADFAARSFGMVVLSSVTASVIGRAVLGDDPFLSLPTFTVDHPREYLLFGLLGLLAGLVGVAFTRVLYAVENACDAAWRGPEWLRPAVGGLVLGLLLLVLPQMYGVGYPVLGAGVTGAYSVGFLAVLLLGKMLATSLTIGIGGSGGVFAPSLFIGAMLGSAFGQFLHAVAPGLAGSPGAYGLIGMGAVFAGAARAPITAVVIMFELTGEYSIILPLMAAIVLATGVSHLVSRDTIYTLKLRRRGIDLAEHPHAAALTSLTAGAVMTPVGDYVDEAAVLLDAVPALAAAPGGLIAVNDADGRFAGVITARTVADTLADGDHADARVADVVEQIATVRTAQTLDEALDVLDRTDAGALPVVSAEDDSELVGWLTHRQVLDALRRAAPISGSAPVVTAE
jgi:CIC family chloride channel protein